MNKTHSECQLNTCLCNNGIPAGDTDQLEESNPVFQFCDSDQNNQCSICDDGYHKEENLLNNSEGSQIRQSVCLQNICTCDYGLPAEGLECEIHEEVICQATGCFEGANFNAGTNICDPNTCLCNNGTAVIAKNDISGVGTVTCDADDEISCYSCHFGFSLNLYDSSNYECQENICTCDHGTLTSLCTENGAVQCAACQKGYSLDSSTQACQAKICSCEHGTGKDDGNCQDDSLDNDCASCDAGYRLRNHEDGYDECVIFCPDGDLVVLDSDNLIEIHDASSLVTPNLNYLYDQNNANYANEMFISPYTKLIFRLDRFHFVEHVEIFPLQNFETEITEVKVARDTIGADPQKVCTLSSTATYVPTDGLAPTIYTCPSDMLTRVIKIKSDTNLLYLNEIAICASGNYQMTTSDNQILVDSFEVLRSYQMTLKLTVNSKQAGSILHVGDTNTRRNPAIYFEGDNSLVIEHTFCDEGAFSMTTKMTLDGSNFPVNTEIEMKIVLENPASQADDNLHVYLNDMDQIFASSRANQCGDGKVVPIYSGFNTAADVTFSDLQIN